MFQEHYLPQTFAYFAGLGGWLAAARLLPELWPRQQPVRFQRPWKEIGIALLGAIGVIGMGQLWNIGIRLPEQGSPGPLLASIN